MNGIFCFYGIRFNKVKRYKTEIFRRLCVAPTERMFVYVCVSHFPCISVFNPNFFFCLRWKIFQLTVSKAP